MITNKMRTTKKEKKQNYHLTERANASSCISLKTSNDVCYPHDVLGGFELKSVNFTHVTLILQISVTTKSYLLDN